MVKSVSMTSLCARNDGMTAHDQHVQQKDFVHGMSHDGFLRDQFVAINVENISPIRRK